MFDVKMAFEDNVKKKQFTNEKKIFSFLIKSQIIFGWNFPFWLKVCFNGSSLSLIWKIFTHRNQVFNFFFFCFYSLEFYTITAIVADWTKIIYGQSVRNTFMKMMQKFKMQKFCSKTKIRSFIFFFLFLKFTILSTFSFSYFHDLVLLRTFRPKKIRHFFSLD